MITLTLSIMIIIQVIVAEGEIKASLALRQAAENIAGSPESLQVSASSASPTVTVTHLTI